MGKAINRAFILAGANSASNTSIPFLRPLGTTAKIFDRGFAGFSFFHVLSEKKKSFLLTIAPFHVADIARVNCFHLERWSFFEMKPPGSRASNVPEYT